MEEAGLVAAVPHGPPFFTRRGKSIYNFAVIKHKINNKYLFIISKIKKILECEKTASFLGGFCEDLCFSYDAKQQKTASKPPAKLPIY